MIHLDRIEHSDGIDLDKTDKSKECKICHYNYFLQLYLQKIKKLFENNFFNKHLRWLLLKVDELTIVLNNSSIVQLMSCNLLTLQ